MDLDQEQYEHFRRSIDELVAELDVLRPENPTDASMLVADACSWLDGLRSESVDQQTDLLRLRADVSRCRALLLHARGELDEAIGAYEHSIGLSARLHDEERLVLAMRSAALCYENAGQQREATRLIFKALERAKAQTDQRLLALVSLTLCALYQAQGAWGPLLEAANRTRELADGVDDLHLRSRAYSAVGVALKYNGQPALGLDWIDRAAELISECALPQEALFLDLNRWFLMREVGQSEALMAIVDDFPEAIRQIPSADGSRLAVMLAEVCLDAGDLDGAEEMLRRADHATADDKMTAHLIDYHRVAANLYEAKGDLGSALAAMRAYAELERKIQGRQAQARLLDLERHFERELASRASEIHQLRNIELVQKNTELIELNEQKDEILSIVAHDLRNPLAAVHMLNDFMLADAQRRDDPELVDQLESVLAAVAEMDVAIGQLLQRNTSDSPPRSIDEIVRRSIDRSADLFVAQCIDLRTSIAPVLANADSIALGGSLDGILACAAESAESGSTVDIDLVSQGENARLSLRVSVGSDVDESKLELSRRLIEQTRGAVETNIDNGTIEFDITIPSINHVVEP